jgi:hypothetical protein
MADGTLRLTLDIEPAQAQAAFAMFGRPGQPVALAALKTAGQQQSEDRAKGGSASKWLGMRCAERDFGVWLERTFPKQACEAIGRTMPERSASIARAVCGVESRAEIDNDKYAKVRFDTLIRQPWIESQGSA